MKATKILGLTLALACALPAIAADNLKFQSDFKGVAAPEMPAKAAALVKKASSRERQAVTVGVVETAVTMNPAAAPAIVGAIARSNPDVAAQAAAKAASLQPSQAAEIAQAAAAAAPSKAAKIVTAVCKAAPGSYREVAVAVAKTVPGSAKQVLKAVGVAIPELEPAIAQSLSGVSGSVSVAAVLDSASSKTVASGTSAARGPAVGPPYMPLTGTPIPTSPLNSSPGPARNYTTP